MKEKFKEYLKKSGYKEFTPTGNPSTIYDYISRIDKICELEHMSWQKLADNINYIIQQYDSGGEKENIGNISHRSVINALKRFQEFIIDKKSCQLDEKTCGAISQCNLPNQTRIMIILNFIGIFIKKYFFAILVICAIVFFCIVRLYITFSESNDDKISNSPTCQEIESYEEAAKQGNADAQFSLGVLYYSGNGVQQNYQKAKEYFEMAAKEGNVEGVSALGVLYYSGHGVQQDYKKAKDYFEMAAKQEDTLAQCALGELYYRGYGVEQDYQKAKEYFEMAAEQGDAYAQFSLGALYCDGYGVRQDYQKAKKYYEMAARQKYVDAEFSLGQLYENGHGVRQDYAIAKEFYGKSCDHGLQKGCNAYKRLNMR